MYGDMSGLLDGVDEVAHQPMTVAIEVEPDQLARPVQHRTARVTANRVGGRDKVKRCFQIEFILTIEPALRQHERLAVSLALGPLEGAAKRRREWQVLAIDAIAPHHAERQSQREGRVRRDVTPERLEPQLRDACIRLSFDLLDFRLEA